MIEILEPVQIMQVPENGGVLAIDLKSVERLMPARVTRGFEIRERPIAEPAQERAGIVDAHLLDFAREVVLPLFDECFSHRVDLVEAAIEPQRRIDAMR